MGGPPRGLTSPTPAGLPFRAEGVASVSRPFHQVGIGAPGGGDDAGGREWPCSSEDQEAESLSIVKLQVSHGLSLIHISEPTRPY